MGQELIIYETMCGSALKCTVAIDKGEKTPPNHLPGKSNFLTLVANDAHMDE